MKWQEAEHQLKEWEDEGCGGWQTDCPITHEAHSTCSGLTRAAHNLMFARLNEDMAREYRRELAAIRA